MLAEFIVNSILCVFIHRIRGSKKRNKIIVDIDIPFEFVQAKRFILKPSEKSPFRTIICLVR